MITPTVVGPLAKSTASGRQDNCVEVAPLSDGGKAAVFVRGLVAGEFSRP